MHATVGSRNTSLGEVRLAGGSHASDRRESQCGVQSGAIASSITSKASNKVLTVKMLFDFHFCFSKTVRKNR